MGGTALLYNHNQISAEDTAPAESQNANEQAEKDPVRVRYQYLLTKGREDKSSILMIPAGRRSKFSLTISTIFSSAILPVPNVSTMIDVGFATPIA